MSNGQNICLVREHLPKEGSQELAPDSEWKEARTTDSKKQADEEQATEGAVELSQREIREA